MATEVDFHSAESEELQTRDVKRPIEAGELAYFLQLHLCTRITSVGTARTCYFSMATLRTVAAPCSCIVFPLSNVLDIRTACRIVVLKYL